MANLFFEHLGHLGGSWRGGGGSWSVASVLRPLSRHLGGSWRALSTLWGELEGIGAELDVRTPKNDLYICGRVRTRPDASGLGDLGPCGFCGGHAGAFFSTAVRESGSQIRRPAASCCFETVRTRPDA